MLQDAEAVADETWQQVVGRAPFAREVVDRVQDYASRLTSLARQLNAFAGSLKTQRYGDQVQTKAVREAHVEYATNISYDTFVSLFSESDFEWLQAIPTYADQSAISNLYVM